MNMLYLISIRLNERNHIIVLMGEENTFIILKIKSLTKTKGLKIVTGSELLSPILGPLIPHHRCNRKCLWCSKRETTRELGREKIQLLINAINQQGSSERMNFSYRSQ